MRAMNPQATKRSHGTLFARQLRSLMNTAAIAALAMAVVACGVGTSGTGTGASIQVDNPPGTASTPTASSGTLICSSNFAATALQCTASGLTAPVTWTNASADGSTPSIRAQVSGAGIVLESPCQGLRFEGNWVSFGDGSAAFVGSYTSTTVTSSTPAVLRVSADVNVLPFILSAVLIDPLGQALLADQPVWRLRVTTDTTPASCPTNP
jgi:hypothetical protein